MSQVGVRLYPVGSELTRGGGAIVDRLVGIAADGRFELRALYLGKRFATEMTVSDLARYRLAGPADHERARAYAASFEENRNGD